jgi:hypothetical protein
VLLLFIARYAVIADVDVELLSMTLVSEPAIEAEYDAASPPALNGNVPYANSPWVPVVPIGSVAM